MKLTHCKLSKNTQRKLLEYFVLEVTARSAADLLDIQPNSAALFYRKIRTIIAYHLELEADEVFEGHVELDESYFGGARKGKRGRGAAGKTAVLCLWFDWLALMTTSFGYFFLGLYACTFYWCVCFFFENMLCFSVCLG